MINSGDKEAARRHFIGEDEIRRMSLNMLVDTGADELCINENIQAILQLPFVEKRRFRMADESVVECDLVGPVEVRFQSRVGVSYALVLPGSSEALLGLLPLESLNVMLDATRQLVLDPEPGRI